MRTYGFPNLGAARLKQQSGGVGDVSEMLFFYRSALPSSHICIRYYFWRRLAIGLSY